MFLYPLVSLGTIAKQSIQGTIVTYIGVAISIVTTFVVMTRFLTAEEIGLSRVLIDAGTLFIGLAQLGTSSSIIRFYPYFKTDDHHDHGFFFWTLLIPLIGFCLVTAVYIFFRADIINMFSEKSSLFVNYFHYVLPLAFFMLYQTVFETNANVRMRIVFPRAVREVILRILLLIIYLLYAFNIFTLDGFVVSLCGIYAIAALLNIIYLFTTNNVSFLPDLHFLRSNPDLVTRYLLYTGFLILSALASAVAPLVSSFLVSAKMGLDYNGIFTIALNIAVIVCIPSRALNAIVSPELSASYKDGNTRQLTHLLKQASSNLFLFGCIIMLGIWINIDLIFHILPNGETYAVAKQTVLLLTISQLLLSTFAIALYAINFSRFYFFSLICSALLTISSVCLNNRLIPIYGINGAAAANCLSYIIFFGCVLLVVRIFLNTTPLSYSHLKTFLITALLFVVNETIVRLWPDMNIWLSASIRTMLLVSIFVIVALQWNISKDVNQYISNKLRHIIKH